MPADIWSAEADISSVDVLEVFKRMQRNRAAAAIALGVPGILPPDKMFQA